MIEDKLFEIRYNYQKEYSHAIKKNIMPAQSSEQKGDKSDYYNKN